MITNFYDTLIPVVTGSKVSSESDVGASESSEDGDSSDGEEGEAVVSSDMDVCHDQQGWQRETII